MQLNKKYGMPVELLYKEEVIIRQHPQTNNDDDDDDKVIDNNKYNDLLNIISISKSKRKPRKNKTIKRKKKN
jgi:hypothetical protein